MMLPPTKRYYYPPIPEDLSSMKKELSRMEANEKNFFDSLKTVPGMPKVDVFFSIDALLASGKRIQELREAIAIKSVDYILSTLETEFPETKDA